MEKVLGGRVRRDVVETPAETPAEAPAEDLAADAVSVASIDKIAKIGD
jgi:hypothetical protein